MDEYIKKQLDKIEAYNEAIALYIEKIKIYNKAKEQNTKPFLIIDNQKQSITVLKEQAK